MSSYNKSTADECIVMGLRVAGSFGAFCNLSHAMNKDLIYSKMIKQVEFKEMMKNIRLMN